MSRKVVCHATCSWIYACVIVYTRAYSWQNKRLGAPGAYIYTQMYTYKHTYTLPTRTTFKFTIPFWQTYFHLLHTHTRRFSAQYIYVTNCRDDDSYINTSKMAHFVFKCNKEDYLSYINTYGYYWYVHTNCHAKIHNDKRRTSFYINRHMHTYTHIHVCIDTYTHIRD
jgi:hypothetical protein